MSELENKFAEMLDAAGITYQRQWKGIPKRRYAYDFAITVRDIVNPSGRVVLLVEINGGRWMRRGAHNTGPAMSRDSEKALLALREGYAVVSVTDDRMELAVSVIKETYGQ